LCTPSDRALLLKHPFTGGQYTFLKHVRGTGNLCYGGVYFHETKKFSLIPDVPKEGNWKTGAFKEMKYPEYTLWGDLPALIGAMFGLH
jgi:hypothetical protein